MFRLLSILCILIFITCMRFDDTNPIDPDYVGNYSLNINWPDTLGTFIKYEIPFTSSKGRDSLVAFTIDSTLDGISEGSLYSHTNSSFQFMFTNEYSGVVSITGYSKNNTPVTHTDTIKIICPFRIDSDSQPTFSETFLCSLAVDSQFNKLFAANSGDSVIWQYMQDDVCTLSIFKNYSVTIDKIDSFSIKAFFIDTLNNKSKEIIRTFPVTLIRPIIDSIPSIFSFRVGTVSIPVLFSDNNDKVDSIFYHLKSDSVSRKEVQSANHDTLVFELWDTDTTELYVWVKDASGLYSDTATVELVLFVPDIVNPFIRLKDPDVDSSKNKFDTLKVDFIGWDNYGIKAVACTTSEKIHITYNADSIKQDTSYWSLTITDLKQGEYLPVKTCAVDSFDNTFCFTFYLYYDSTLTDVTGPKIEILSGPSGRVFADTGTFRLKVTDLVDTVDTINDGIDTVFYEINGIYKGPVDSVNDSVYQFSYNNLPYHWNTITIVAYDGSGSSNKTTESVIINYNTYPSGISNISPQDSAVDVETDAGVTFSWIHAQDEDGDTITYTIYYRRDSSFLDSFTTRNNNFTDTTMQGGRKYYWYVNVTTELDTIRCPDSTGYYTFTTVNHPTTISGLKNDTLTINDTVTFRVSANDKEGILRYDWDFGDGEGKTGPDSVTHVYTSASVYKAYVFVVDSLGDTTNDSAFITITNEYPTIDALPDSSSDTLRIGYNDSIRLAPTATDDGTIVSYEWSFDEGLTYDTVGTGDTTFLAGVTDLPKAFTYIFRVTDEDDNQSCDTIYVVVDMLWKPVPGTQWIQGRSSFAIAADSNYLYVLGGLKSSTLYNDVYRSGDGSTWDSLSISPDSSYSKRYNHAATVKNDTLYVLGGDLVCDIWRSCDGGLTWDSIGNLIDVDNTYSPKLPGAEFIQVGDSIFLLGGNTATGLSNKVFLTHNGEAWRGLNTLIGDPRFPASDDFSAWPVIDTIWTLSVNELWYSSSDLSYNFGDKWYLQNDNIPSVERIVVYIDNMYGLSKDSFKYSNDRGLTWIEMTSAPPWRESTYQRFTVFKSKMWVITDKGIWYSDDIP